MKLVVLGANGRTGNLVVQEALAEGDAVTAVVRPEAMLFKIRHERLTVVVGDCCEHRFLTEVFARQDAAISTLGGRSPTKKATSIYWKSAETIADAALDSGMRNVAVTSTALLFPARRLVDGFLTALVPHVVQSASRMEETLTRANLDLIVGRCGFLTNHEERLYRSELGSLPDGGSSVSRLGLARFLIDAIRTSKSGPQIYGVSGPA